MGLTLAGWLVGLASALLLDSVRGTRRLRGVAKALLEEVRRIRVELETWGGFSDVQIAGATSVVPTVHDAVQRLYPDAAAIEPEVLGLLAQEDDEGRIEQPGTGFIGFIEPAPPYHPGPRRKLPSWAKHLRDLRPLKLVE